MKFSEWLQTLPEEQLDEFAATAAATSPIWAPALKTAAVTAGAYVLSKAPGVIKNMMSKKNDNLYDPSDKVKRPKVTKTPLPKDGESWTGGIGGKPTRNLSGRYKTHKQGQEKLDDFNKNLTSSSPGAEFKPDNSGKPGDNPEARTKIRDTLNKLKNKKN